MQSAYRMQGTRRCVETTFPSTHVFVLLQQPRTHERAVNPMGKRSFALSRSLFRDGGVHASAGNLRPTTVIRHAANDIAWISQPHGWHAPKVN